MIIADRWRRSAIASLAACTMLALAVATPRAQSATEVWQAVLSLPTISGSGLPAMPVPAPGLAFPTGVAQTLSGDLVVADSGNNLLRIFDASTGAEKVTITGGSRGLSWPSAVRVDACGHVLVTDYGFNRLREFTSSGREIGSPVGGLSLPWGLAMTAGTVVREGCTVNGTPLSVGGRIAVVSSLSSDGLGGGSVNVYDGNLNLLFTLGAGGTGKLSAPVGVAIDPSTGNFLVTDTGTPTEIKVFDPTGVFLFSFTDPSLAFPDDILFDSQGRVVVADSLTQVVDFFTLNYDGANPAASTATLDFSITSENTPGTFLAPSGLAFDSAGRLLVTTGTYDPVTFLPVASTQYVLIFDRPTLAIQSIDIASGGSPVTTAVPPGTALTFTVTAISSTGQVDDGIVTGTITDTDGVTQVPLGSVSVGTIVAGTAATASFTYTVPAGISANSSLTFSATATGTVNNGTASTEVTAPGFAPAVVHVVVTGDTTPPVSTITLNPASPQAGTWYAQPLSITLTAADEPGGSGIAQLNYQFGGLQLGADPILHTITASSGATSLTANTSITQDGAASSTITYWAIDEAGNAETPHTQTFHLDRTPPYATFGAPTPSATGPAGSPVSWWNGSVTIPFTAVDRGSGVASKTPSSGSVTFTVEGANQKQTVSITDNAGNTSDPANGLNTSPTVNIDLTRPVVGTPTAAPAANANGWNNTPVQVTFTATDNLAGFLAADSASGVNSDLNGKRVVTLSTEGRSLSPASQAFTDLAGNVSLPATYSTPINIDRTPPTVNSTSYLSTVNLSQTLSANANGWFNALVTVRMAASDNLSGFAAADATTGVAGGLQGVKSLALTEGLHTASSLTISDLAGNSASAPVPAVKIDVTPPTVASPAFVDRSTGTPVSPSAAGWYRGQIDVSFTASDGLSGFSGGATDARSIALATDQMNQTVTVPTFTDLAGNTSAGYAGNAGATVLSNLSVDSTAPQVAVAATASPAWTDPDTGRAWFSAPVSVSFTATDALSGFTGGAHVVSATQTLGDGTDDLASQTFTDLAGNASTGSFGPVSVDTTAPTVTANITPNGNGETVGFETTDAGSGVASCTVAVDGVVVQSTCDPIAFVASDSGKTVTATVVDHVGNTSAVDTSISFGPPEAYNQFDPVTHDVLVYGFDPATGASLGAIQPASIFASDSHGVICDDHHGHHFGPFPGDWWQTYGGSDGSGLRVYHIVGASGDALTLVEAVKFAGHEAQVLVIGFQYTVDGTTEPFIFAPFATKKFQWSENLDGSLKTLNQDMTIGLGSSRVEVQADYRSDQNQTTVHTKISGPDTFATLDGLVLLRMATNRAGSSLIIGADGIAPVPGPSGTLDPRDGGFWWGGSHGGDPGSHSSDQAHQDDGNHDGQHGSDQADPHDGDQSEHHEADHQDGDQGDHHDGDHDRQDGDHHDHDADHDHDVQHQNHAPVVTLSNLTSHEGEAVAVQVQATDADGDALLFAATGLPAGITMSATGEIAGTLSYTTAGIYESVVTVTDSKGLTGSASFVWTVVDVNRAPTVSATNQTSSEDDTVSVQITGQDPDGDALTYSATGLPPGLSLNGSSGLVTGHLDFESAGTYTVTVTAADAANQHGTATFTWTVTDVPQAPSPAGAARIRHAPSLNGSSIVNGSLQIMSAESFAVNGGAKVTGNIFVPGLPSVQVNSSPAHFGGTIDAEGASAPSGYVITLNGGTWLDHLVRRTDPAALPTVAPPADPAGTRDVSLNNSTDEMGSFATIGNLTLNGNVGAIAVPAGTYGSFTANGTNSFVLGEAGATTPAIYSFQSLTLNGSSRITLAGPVVIMLRNGLALSGSIGDPAHPEWLTLGIASGGLELNSGITVAGYVIAPAGTVTIDGNSQLLGGVAADRLVLNSSALLTLVTR